MKNFCVSLEIVPNLKSVTNATIRRIYYDFDIAVFGSVKNEHPRDRIF